MPDAKPAIWSPGYRRKDPLAQELLAHWPIRERAGSHVGDVTGHFDGVLTNQDLATAWGSNSDGPVLNLTDTGSRVAVPTTALPVTGFSLFMLVDPIDATHRLAIYGPDSASGWGLFPSSQRLFFRLEYSAGNYIGRNTGVDYLTGGGPYSIVVTVAPGATLDSDIAIYIDGVQSDTTDSADNPFQIAGELRLGSRVDGDSSGVSMGLAAIWDTVLSVREIQQLHVDPYRLITPPKRTALFAEVPVPTAGNPWNYYAQQAAVAG